MRTHGTAISTPEMLARADGGESFEYACSGCMLPTDTGLSFRGEAEWAVAGLMQCGIPETDAIGMVELFCAATYGSDKGMVPNGDIDIPIRMCAACASKAGLPVGLIVRGGELPVIVG